MVDRRDNESDRVDKWWTAETMSQIELINGGQERQ